MKVLHVITTLDTGGAEMMLWKVLSRLDARFRAEVVSLTTEGPLTDRIRALGVPVRALGMRQRLPNPFLVARLARWIREAEPDLVQTWMSHSDLVGGLAGRWAGVPVAWSIRHSDLSPRTVSPTTRLVLAICARLSRSVPSRILCCSEASRQVHVALGYDPSKMVVVPNGFDLQRFRPDPDARAAVRSELDLTAGAPVIGKVARFDPQKDHATFIRAAGELSQRRPDARYVLVGKGVDGRNRALVRAIEEAGIPADRFRLLGLREDVPRLLCALDVATSTSAYGEGSPNAVGEAMACGVPCVVTDSGDSADMVGDTGRVAPRRDPGAVARAWDDLISLPRADLEALGRAARERVRERYSLEVIAGRYGAFFEEAAGRGRENGGG